jgi:UDP-glucose 4-epimerase
MENGDNVMKKILVVGGAGYIGSHMVLMLAEQGYSVVTLDNLSTGHRDAVLAGEFIEGDLGDKILLDKLFKAHDFSAVMHFAAFIQVGESVENPAKYYQNNLAKTLNLLDSMIKHKINKFIFSSTAAVFGEPEYIPIDLDHPKNPVNPYGKSKYMIEQILQDYDQAYDLRSICLRYFNAAGADPKARLGERHDPESHLIPLILKTALKKRECIAIFGKDYNTPDGTCIRDYIHIIDLCQAHLLALNQLLNNAPSTAYNLGNGLGFSVQEVIHAAEKITGEIIAIKNAPRRAGDPARLIADSSAAKKILNWQPIYPNLEDILLHAWEFEKKYV